MFGKKREEPVRRDAVRAIVKAGMKETDAADRSGVDSEAFRKAKDECDKATGAATQAERRAAHEALRRHGY